MNIPASLPALILAVAAPLAAQTASDDFNRANGTNMGPDWLEMDGDTQIDNNRGVGNSPWWTGWMHHASLTGSYEDAVQTLEIYSNGFGGDQIALMAGLDPATWDCVYAMIADNDGDGMFDRVIFYRGINGGAWGGSSVFYDLVAPMSAGLVTLSFDNAGDDAVLEVENFATGVTEQFVATGILSHTYGPPTGVNVGIAHFGDPYFDNWTGSFAPTGPILSVTNLVAGQVAAVSVAQATSGGTVLVGYSVRGGGPVSTVYGDMMLTPPYTQLPTMIADPAGVASLSAPVPPGTTGVQVWLHALDLGSATLSNALSMAIG